MLRFLFFVVAIATFLKVGYAGLYEKGSGVSILTEKNFEEKVLKSDDVWIVEFYAPWCGHCKALTPEYKKAAKALKGHAKLGAVDATENKELGSKYNINGFPTIKVFGKDKSVPTEYEGGRKAKDFIVAARKAIKEAHGKDLMKLPEEETADSGASFYTADDDVIALDKTSFEEKVLKSDDFWIVEFYAPWCGHCKALTPEFKKAAKALKGYIKLGAVDATVSDELASKYNVKGFPTIKVFGKDKSVAAEYEGGRKAKNFIAEARKLLKDIKEVPKMADEESTGFYTGTDVVELTDETFESEVVNGDEPWLVEFYAPWCGHCKSLAPEYKKAATELLGSVRLGAIDATENQKWSGKYKVNGFPTIKFIPPKQAENPEDYNEARTTSAIVNFCNKKAELYPGKPLVVNQIKDQEALDTLVEKKSTVGIFIVPHVIDTGAEGRKAMIEMFGRVASATRSKPISYGWIVGAEHNKFEETLGIFTNYPTFVAINAKKLRYSSLHGAFTEESIVKMVNQLMAGKKTPSTLKEMPKLSKDVPLWDGKDYVPPKEEDL